MSVLKHALVLWPVLTLLAALLLPAVFATEPAIAATPDSAAAPTVETFEVPGLVCDESGQPVSGAAVQALGTVASEVVTSAVDGSFTLHVATADRLELRLLASADARQRQGTYVHVSKEGAPLPDVRITLRPARQIVASVVDGDGKPVERATVGLRIVDLRQSIEVESDVQGSAVLLAPSDLPLEYLYAIKLDAGLDYFIYRRPNEAAKDAFTLTQDHHDPLRLVLRGLRTVHVHGVDEQQQPVVDVNVQLQGVRLADKGGRLETLWWGKRGVRTDHTGTSTFPIIPVANIENLYFYFIKNDRYLPRRAELVATDIASDVTAQLVSLIPITGHVASEDGQPAVGALVRAEGQRPHNRYSAETRTDAQGNYELRVDPDHFFNIAAQLDRAASPIASRLVRSARIDSVDLQLGPATRVFGHATEKNHPELNVAGRQVSVTVWPEIDEYARVPIEQLLPTGSPVNLGRIRPALKYSAETDANGRYELYVSPGVGDVNIYERDARSNHVEIYPIDSPEVEANLTVEIGRTVEFTGRVVLASNPAQGVAEADVLCDSGLRIATPNPTFSGRFIAKTDSDGKFHFSWIPADALISARSNDGKLARYLPISALDTDCTIPLEPLATAHGRLLDQSTGRPLADVPVFLRAMMGRELGNGTNFATTTNGQGEFLLSVPIGWEFSLGSRLPGQEFRSARPALPLKLEPQLPEQIELGDVRIVDPVAAASTMTTRERYDHSQGSLRVVDEQGQVIPDAETRYYTWDRGHLGKFRLGELGRYGGTIEVPIRAAGFASTVALFLMQDREKLASGEAVVTLARGSKVRVRLKLPEGMHWPEGVAADFYPEEFRLQLLSRKRHADEPRRRTPKEGDYNLLNTSQTAPGEYEFLLTPGSSPFYVGLFAPGFIRWEEWGPFSFADFTDGLLEIAIERPASLTVRFDPGKDDPSQLPFSSAGVTIQKRGKFSRSNSETVGRVVGDERTAELTLDNLGPGEYQVLAITDPKADSADIPGLDFVNPGRYFETVDVVLVPGETRKVELTYHPIEQSPFKGNRSAVLHFKQADGSPASGRKVKINYCDCHYGYWPVYEGVVPESGSLLLEGLTDRQFGEKDIEPYTVEFDKAATYDFRLSGSVGIGEFTFQLPPQIGDPSPDFALVNVNDGAACNLSDLRGKVVCLALLSELDRSAYEFLTEINREVADYREAWGDQVVYLAVNLDATSDRIKQYWQCHQFQELTPYWASAGRTADDESSPAEAFKVYPPGLLVIGRNGQLVWKAPRRHLPAEFAAQIQKALGQPYQLPHAVANSFGSRPPAPPIAARTVDIAGPLL